MSAYEEKIAGGKIRCLLCPRRCELAEGACGFCQIRSHQENEIKLLSYGYTTGLAVDPIEKKPLYHFLPGSKVMSFGTRGCNMGCLFCQNWTISKSREGIRGLHAFSPETIAQAAIEYQCKSVAFTYNEPTVFFEYALDTAKECRQIGVKTVAVTAGYINPEPRREFYRYMDAVNIDLKAFTSEFYRRNCQADLQVVLDTIKYVKNESNAWLELTTLLIEGENDRDDELKRQCDWIVSNVGTTTPLHLSAFHPAWKFQDRPATNPKTLVRAWNIAKSAGLSYVYTGNVVLPESSATHCGHCGKEIITREYFSPTMVKMNGSTCGFCGEVVSGVFELEQEKNND
ncbi:MAG: AmmeMemoRadiSam system radical SAM enzyme [Thermoguttaceae bacterium]|nr:AmmeMemoRadiSam system radical SAM enzyme [Thermoguttaceae bacterium]